ncbi:Unknown protein sequence [Pseudomonas syringae pv. aceris]|nr:Unknown protein sequence [Pseudomonas syringae pv. aceris]
MAGVGACRVGPLLPNVVLQAVKSLDKQVGDFIDVHVALYS